MKNNKKWQCVGANYLGRYTANMVGEIHGIEEWLKLLFPQYSPEKIITFFDGYTEKEIVSYIKKNCGKRLKEIK